jgi:hypothetical protein
MEGLGGPLVIGSDKSERARADKNSGNRIINKGSSKQQKQMNKRRR